METTELYCGVGTCLCTEFEPRDDDPNVCRCEHPRVEHRDNEDG